MSFLAPLYVLGVLGIGLPILAHLIRRRPRDQHRFSSLLFLRPSPPVLTRRSRLDQWLLMALRALAIGLLAFAFARPFLRQSETLTQSAPGRRVVILVDRSASMQRSAIWANAIASAKSVINDLSTSDSIAIMGFDRDSELLYSLKQSDELEWASRKESALQALDQLQPTWNESRLGRALVDAADQLRDSMGDGKTDSSSDAKSLIVVISDMQAGGQNNLESLQGYEWPQDIGVVIREVRPEQTTNASLALLQSDAAAGDQIGASESTTENSPLTKSVRVRVTNAANSTRADFLLGWQTSTGEPIGDVVPVNAGPGESRMIQMPLADIGKASAVGETKLRLALSGDDHDFDNVRFVSWPAPIDQRILMIGGPSESPRDSLLYYLERAPLNNSMRRIAVSSISPDQWESAISPSDTPLVVLTRPVTDAVATSLRRYVSQGGGLLAVVEKQSDLSLLARTLQQITDSKELELKESSVDDYAMWSQIDFSSPLFLPLSDPRFNDFSKIRFWSHRSLSGISVDNEEGDRAASDVSWKTVVSFDDGDPALVELTIDQGKVWILTAGWQPQESQLALSTKFVPLVDQFLNNSKAVIPRPQSLLVSDRLPFSVEPTSQLVLADGTQLDGEALSKVEPLDAPGFYEYRNGDFSQTLAVNVSESESRTEPMSSDLLESYSVKLGNLSDPVEEVARKRQQRDVELEGQQRLWQWLLFATLSMIAVETLVSGYLRRSAASQPTA